MDSRMKYIQLPLATFLMLHPEYREMFPLRIFHDDEYVVRIQPESGIIEVGFIGDDWELN